MTTYSAPASAILRSSCCTSIGSGVVSLDGSTSSPTIEHTVPMSPVLWPACSRIDFTRKLEVVFPFVPVMPTSFIPSAGFP